MNEQGLVELVRNMRAIAAQLEGPEPPVTREGVVALLREAASILERVQVVAAKVEEGLRETEQGDGR
jgi:hypothetical protein